MKKIVILLLSLALTLCFGLALTACGNSADNKGSVAGCSHEYGEEQVIKNATCDEDGMSRKICKLCQTPVDTPIAALGHDYKVEAESLPTCTADGYRNSLCKRCGKTENESLSATGHSYKVELSSQPTKTSEGYLSYHCNGCSKSGTHNLPTIDNAAYTYEMIDEDTFNYTYVWEGETVKFTHSNFIFYKYWSKDEENVPYKFDVYKLYGYTGSKTSITLPTTYNGCPVVSINYESFINNTNLVSVIIPEPTFSFGIDDIKEKFLDGAEIDDNMRNHREYLGYGQIERGAFSGCTALTSVTLPSTMKRIDSEAFKGCAMMSEINLGSVNNIEDSAFSGCSSLLSANLSSLVSINNYAFKDCTKLSSLTLGSSLETIGGNAFENCIGLTDVVIPDSVVNVGSAIFKGCVNIKTLKLPRIYWGKLSSLFSGYLYGNMEIGSYYDANGADVPALDCVTLTLETEIPNYAFYECSKIKKIVIPENTVSIGTHSFYGCSQLETFVFPDTVRSIGNGAFKNINAFNFTQDFDNKMYYIGSASNPYFYLLGADAVSASGDVYIQNGCKFVANNAFDGCNTEAITSIHIPSSVERIGMLRYMGGYTYGTSLNIYYNGTAERFTELGFSCAGWQNLYLYVGSGSSWSEVTELVISDKVTEIERGAYTTYGNFPNFESVRIPASVKKFDSQAFNNSSITSVYYEGTLADWCAIEFVDEYSNPMNAATRFFMLDNADNWTEVTEITVPDTVAKIGQYVFYGFSGITKLIIPDSVEEIYVSSYSGCQNLSGIYYEGTEQEWNNICNKMSSSEDDSANKYFYSESRPTLADYINGLDRTLWHYDDNDKPELWSAKRGSTVDGKTYSYASSSVTVSDDYWGMIASLKQQGMLDALEDPDLIQMATNSSTKAEFESALSEYYGDQAENLTLAFAGGVITLTQNSDSTDLEYLEFDGEIYYVLTQGKGFTICDNGNALDENIVTEYITVTHHYSIVTE